MREGMAAKRGIQLSVFPMRYRSELRTSLQ
jgi:hypothetical protein